MSNFINYRVPVSSTGVHLSAVVPVPVVFINCDVVPFLDRIMSLDKIVETRTRNMLRALSGHRVLLAETHRGRRPLARCWATIGTPMAVRSREEWERWREIACIPAGSRYDWQPGTTVKWLYPLLDVVPVDPFHLPDGRRHGRVWMELTTNTPTRYERLTGGKSHEQVRNH